MGINNIITATITRETRPLGETGFGTILIVGENATFSERVKFYGEDELATLASELTGGESDLEYIMAASTFAQTPHTSRIAIGKKLKIKLVFAGDLITGNKVNLKVNGSAISEVTYHTSHANTMSLIATELETKSTYISDATVTDDREITILPVAGITLALTEIVVSSGATQTTASQTGDALYSTALNAMKLYNNDWYGVCLADRTNKLQQNVVTWVQSNEKVGIFVSDDSNIIDQDENTDTTSLAYFVSAGSYDRSSVIYHSHADDEALDTGLLGILLTFAPGSYTPAFKTVSGCTYDTPTTTQITNAHAKYCSTYERVKDTNMLLFGWVGSGEYIDIPIFSDWLIARISESVLSTLSKTKKVSFTNAGITSIESNVRSILEEGIQNNGITPNEFDKTTSLQIGGYWTNFPKSSSVSSNNKSLRNLPNCKFKAWLAGAIHTVAIEGTLTL